MNAPLSRYLTRFPSEEASPAIVLEPVLVAHEPAPIDTFETKLQVALAAARRDADLERERSMTALKEDHARDLASALEAARAEWCAIEASASAALVDAAFSQLRDLLSERLAAVMRPLLIDAVIDRTLDALGKTIDRILADPKHPCLTLKGPRDLVEAIKAQRPAVDGLTYETGDGVELSVTADGMRIETRLGRALVAITGAES